MLKAKVKSTPSKAKLAALKQLAKEDNDTPMFVRLTSSEMTKLKVELAKKRMSMGAWVKLKIKEI